MTLVNYGAIRETCELTIASDVRLCIGLGDVTTSLSDYNPKFDCGSRLYQRCTSQQESAN